MRKQPPLKKDTSFPSPGNVRSHFPEVRRGVIRAERWPVIFRMSPIEGLALAWLDAKGEAREAAKLLSVLADGFTRDDDLVAILSEHVAARRSDRMMQSFAGGRLDEAIEHARFIRDRFPESPNHALAQTLAEELPRRRGDFRDFCLPLLPEWARLREELSRPELIGYLCERLRLIKVRDIQGSTTNGAEHLQSIWVAAPNSEGSFETVVNPFRELTGRKSWLRRGSQMEALVVDSSDIATIAPYLLENWILPESAGFDYGGSPLFPVYHIHKTRSLVIDVINRLAGETLIIPEDFEALSDSEARKLVADLVQRYSLDR